MTDFLSSLKDDLLDRRVLPLVALVGVALAAALAYAVLGGSGSAATVAVNPTGPVHAPGIIVTPSPTNPDQPVAETTSGTTHQRRGLSRNPFNLLVAPAKLRTGAAGAVGRTGSLTTSVGAGTSPTSPGGPGLPAPSGGGSTPTPPSKPSRPPKPTTVYQVAVLFGAIPAGTPPQTAQLTPYESLKLLTPLPSAKQPLLVFRGVTLAGKSATFTLVGEAILHGSAACLPSASQCQAIDLKPGASEQLEYLAPTGGIVTYELRVVSIVASTTSAKGAKSFMRGESKLGREVLRRAGLVAVPDLHYASQVGVLVFDAHPAFAARARRAARQRHHWR
jgi:hypothetical protein